MIASDALILIAEIEKGKVPKGCNSFLGGIFQLAKSGKSLSSKQGWRLQEIYRRSQGGESTVYHERGIRA